MIRHSCVPSLPPHPPPPSHHHHHQGWVKHVRFLRVSLVLWAFLHVCCLVVTDMVGRPFRSCLSMSAMSGQRAQGAQLHEGARERRQRRFRAEARTDPAVMRCCSLPCGIGSHISRLRHLGRNQCSHGLTSRPLESCHHQCLKAVCGGCFGVSQRISFGASR